uniref:Leucine-rich repeat containing protein n=1 Tax=Rhizophora mucronata TaxID=61149 RepID=A0A2P2KSE1_RHIMU
MLTCTYWLGDTQAWCNCTSSIRQVNQGTQQSKELLLLQFYISIDTLCSLRPLEKYLVLSDRRGQEYQDISYQYCLEDLYGSSSAPTLCT